MNNHVYGRNNRAFDPNFKFCNFCKNDSSRNDNLRFTHWVSDKETGACTCPFLAITVCGICLEGGHTPNRCPNRSRLPQMQMAAMMIDNGWNIEAKIARMEYEDEMMRREHAKWFLSKEKSCAFCVNYKDDFHRTHTLGMCPRLACMTCKYCGCQGHTPVKCPQKLRDQMLAADETGEFILDFDAEEMCVCG